MTIRQLAALSGYSRSTISLALRGHSSIPGKTRDLILELARKHGYTPDPLVRELMNKLRTPRSARQKEKLAYLTSWDTPDGWKSARNDTMWYRGARERAASLGFEIEHFWAKEPRMSGARLSKILYTRGIRGLIVAPLARPRGHLSLHWQHFAACAISFTAIKPDLHRVSHSHLNGMRTAIRRLRHLGYRRVGLTMLESQIKRVNDGWMAPFALYQQGLSPKLRVPPLLVKSWNREQFKEWIYRHEVDVVVTNMQSPLSDLRALGLRVPEDIGYLALDRSHEDCRYACIDQLPAVVGGVAVDLVVGQIARNDFGLPEHPQTILLDGVCRDGETVCRK